MQVDNTFPNFRANSNREWISIYELRQCAPWSRDLCSDLLDAMGDGKYSGPDFPEAIKFLEPERVVAGSSVETEDGHLPKVVEQLPSNYHSQTPEGDFSKACFSSVDFPSWYIWHQRFFESTDDQMAMWDRVWVPIRVVAHYAKSRRIPLPEHWKAVPASLKAVKAFTLREAVQSYDESYGAWPAKSEVVSLIKDHGGNALSERRIKRILQEAVPHRFKSGRLKGAEQRHAQAVFEEHFPRILNQASFQSRQ